jgi:1-acyl-sn-glycerol-3-phosphate acyltransferase
MTSARSTVFLIYMYSTLIIIGLVGLPALLGPRNWVRKWVRLYLSVTWFGLRWISGVTYEVRGLDHLPRGGALIGSKHMSMWETIAFWTILPDPAIILKQSLSFIPVFGWFAMALGNIKVDRAGGAKALRTMLQDAEKRGQEGRQVVIFPEGTRVEPGERPDLKPGIAGLYKSMKVPCVPVALNSGVYLKKYCGLRKPGKIVIEFLDPIQPGMDKSAFLETLHDRINTGTDALLREDGVLPEASV